MSQRVGIARTMLHDPRVIILDEPANGLDPQARIEMRDLLLKLAAMGKTLLVTSHILPELDAHLATSAWVAGDNFTVADIDLLVTIEFLAWIKESVPDDCPHLKSWYARATARVA